MWFCSNWSSLILICRPERFTILSVNCLVSSDNFPAINIEPCILYQQLKGKILQVKEMGTVIFLRILWHFVTVVNQSQILSAVLLIFNIYNSSAASSTLSSHNWLSLYWQEFYILFHFYLLFLRLAAKRLNPESFGY